MRMIAFAWTTPQLLRGEKTVTRRTWSTRHAKGFHAGDLVAAYDQSTRAGGKQVGTIRLTADPYQERIDAIPEADIAAEGFPGMVRAEWLERWTERGYQLHDLVWVVRFDLVQA